MIRLRAAALAFLLVSTTAQTAGIDETIETASAPSAELVGKIVFFKIALLGAQLPLVVLWLVVGAVFFCLLHALHQHTRLPARHSAGARRLCQSE